MKTLLGEHDYLLIVEKMMIHEVTGDRSSGLILGPDLYDPIYKTLHLQPKLLEQALRRDLLRVLDYHRSLCISWPTDSAKSVLKWWIDLAASVNISESELRAKEEASKKQITPTDIVGCSWSKCALFEKDIRGAEFSLCTGCRKAAYCGVLCQTRYVM